MTRLWILIAVGTFCVLTAVRPDPRLRAAIEALSEHSHQTQETSNGSFYCPMDPDVRSVRAGRCPRCGMILVSGAPDLLEYRLDLGIEPSILRPGDTARLTFALLDPRNGSPVRNFEVVHEQLFHVFVVSQDLSFFVHTHPERNEGDDFHLDLTLPKPGMYRVLSDFYPSGGNPQLLTNTIIVPGGDPKLVPATLRADLQPRATQNARAELHLGSPQVVAREATQMVFRISPGDLEPYLGAWGHMLAVSADLIDMMHSHPRGSSSPDRGFRDIEFTMVFPRAGVYRTWVQFQRAGIVNTVAFDVPVAEMAR